MTDIVYQGGKKAVVEGLLFADPDVRLRLTTTNFTGDSQTDFEDIINVADITTLGEFAGVGYQEIDAVVTSFEYDDTDDKYKLIIEDGEFNEVAGSVAPGPYDALGVLVVLNIDGTEANDIVLGWTDAGGFPVNGSGTAISYVADTDGILRI